MLTFERVKSVAGGGGGGEIRHVQTYEVCTLSTASTTHIFLLLLLLILFFLLLLLLLLLILLQRLVLSNLLRSLDPNNPINPN